MKQLATLAALFCLVGTTAFAQRGGFRGGGFRSGGFGMVRGGGFGHGGFGHGGFGLGRPGFGHGGFIGGGFVGGRIGVPGSRFGFGFGNIVFPGGFRQSRGARPFFHNRGFFGYGYAPYLPFYGYPLDYSDFGYMNNEYPCPSSPSVVVIYPQPSQSPGVVINEEAPPRPTIREYGSRQQQKKDPDPADPVVFQIAMKDRSVSSALAYWVIGDRLNYIDPQGVHFEIPLQRVDRSRSVELNRSHGIDFGLPQG